MSAGHASQVIDALFALFRLDHLAIISYCEVFS